MGISKQSSFFLHHHSLSQIEVHVIFADNVENIKKTNFLTKYMRNTKIAVGSNKKRDQIRQTRLPQCTLRIVQHNVAKYKISSLS